jgi:hypothetical protein
MGGICCAAGVLSSNCVSGLCDISTGACSTKSEVGGVCSSTDDCFKGTACLGGRCCSFSDSSRADSSYLRAGCSACGDENARGYQGELSLPGKCLSCNSGYTYLSGDPIRRTQLGMLEQETTYLHSLGDACQMTSAVVLT